MARRKGPPPREQPAICDTPPFQRDDLVALPGMEPLSLEQVQVTSVRDAKTNLLVALHWLEQVAIDHGSVEDRQLCAILRTALIAHGQVIRDHDAESIDSRAKMFLAPLETAAADVFQELQDQGALKDFGPSGLRPVGPAWKPENVEAQQLVEVIADAVGWVRREDSLCSELAKIFVDGLLRFAPTWIEKAKIDHGTSAIDTGPGFSLAPYELNALLPRIVRAFESCKAVSQILRGKASRQDFQELVREGLGAIGVGSTKDIFGADDKRAKRAAQRGAKRAARRPGSG